MALVCLKALACLKATILAWLAGCLLVAALPACCLPGGPAWSAYLSWLVRLASPSSLAAWLLSLATCLPRWHTRLNAA
eukprot:16144484-Heterocapsa_arctica.AAC.1